MPKVDILGVKVDAIDKSQLHEAIANAVTRGERMVVAYANVHAVNIAQEDEEFRWFLNKADVVYCDGEGVRFGARILGANLPERAALTRWIWDLTELCERKKFSIFLLGSTKELLEEAIANLTKRSPSLIVAGSHHGYFQKVGPESDAVVESINAARPNLLYVGFGMPTQEYWISRNLLRLKTNVILPAGSMINYVAGSQRVAPKWMSDIGMEWLHRLFQEPSRLWRRYLIGNPVFIARVLMHRLLKGAGK